ncbi:hypothetical protein [Pseudomonas juntendi]|uniref:Uncharacterized protein n=1 Tax=Pseudomonas juntendi TaxID=2666183 RepID=A0ABZ2JJ72_9PSED|nr:hypothetical protein [Pseudomonas putida]
MTINAALDYLENTVKPTVQEFLNDKSNVRRARLAAIVTYHVWDYLGVVGNRQFKEKTKPEHLLPDKHNQLMIQTVRAAADASKHFNLEFKHVATHADQVVAEESPGLFGAPFGEGIFAEANEVHLVLDTAEQIEYGCHSVNLAVAVIFMVKYWECRLQELQSQ